jgi:translation elongation factor EF-1alpha
MYGIYPALYHLRELQDKEDYEGCTVLKRALDEVMTGREYGLTTNVDDKSLEENYRIIMNCPGSDLLHNNMPHYIEGFKQFIF